VFTSWLLVLLLSNILGMLVSACNATNLLCLSLGKSSRVLLEPGPWGQWSRHGRFHTSLPFGRKAHPSHTRAQDPGCPGNTNLQNIHQLTISKLHYQNSVIFIWRVQHNAPKPTPNPRRGTNRVVTSPQPLWLWELDRITQMSLVLAHTCQHLH